MSCGRCNQNKGDKTYSVEDLKFAPQEIINKIKKYVESI